VKLETRQDLKASSVSPSFGIGFNLRNPQWSQSVSFQFDIFISKHEAYTKYAYAFVRRDVVPNSAGTGYTTVDIYERYNYKGAFSYKSDILFTNLGVRYEYPKYKFRPLIEAGASHLQFNNLKQNRHEMKDGAWGVYVGLGCDYRLNQKGVIQFRVDGTHFVHSGLNSRNYGRHFDAKLGYSYIF
jgi:hypothetical protein